MGFRGCRVPVVEVSQGADFGKSVRGFMGKGFDGLSIRSDAIR